MIVFVLSALQPVLKISHKISFALYATVISPVSVFASKKLKLSI